MTSFAIFFITTLIFGQISPSNPADIDHGVTVIYLGTCVHEFKSRIPFSCKDRNQGPLLHKPCHTFSFDYDYMIKKENLWLPLVINLLLNRTVCMHTGTTKLQLKLSIVHYLKVAYIYQNSIRQDNVADVYIFI